MKYTALEFEIIKATSEDIITTSSLHTGIHRFDKSSTDSNYEGVASTLFDNGINEFFDL
ncbi:MAG: hypothetical protein IKB38_08785 [Clostridia bacterium]|nr:hypothetical protein [Clostridia bacterium]